MALETGAGDNRNIRLSIIMKLPAQARPGQLVPPPLTGWPGGGGSWRPLDWGLIIRVLSTQAAQSLLSNRSGINCSRYLAQPGHLLSPE